jgi:PAS domain S-box-containing protein
MTTARSLAAVVDREIEKHIAIGWTLAHSSALLAGNWPEFRSVAMQTHAYLPGSWIIVFDLNQHMLVNTLLPLGEHLPGRSLREVEERALATGKPQVSDVAIGRIARRFVAFAAIPVLQDGTPRYLLQVVLDPERFQKLLLEQDYPRDWLVGIIDRNGNFVARLPDEAASHVGHSASEGWRAAIGHGTEGVVEHLSLEGDPIVQAYVPTAFGWTVGVGISKAAIEAPLRRTEWLLLAASLGCIALGLTLASLIGRRFLRGTKVLHAAANDMAAEKPVAPARTGVREIDGAVAAFAAASDLLRARAEERDLVIEVAPNGMVLTSSEGQIIFVNEQVEKLFGYARQELVGQKIEMLIPNRFRDGHPANRGSYLAHPITRPMGSGRDVYGRRKDGTEMPLEIGLSPIRTAQGIAVLSAIVDITGRKHLEESQQLIIRELQHRTRNLFAVFQIIANRSIAENKTAAEIKFVLDGRLQALAKAYEILANAKWEGASLARILDQELAGFSKRVKINCCEVMLRPTAVQQFVLIAHELATNALKYGALSTPEGYVAVEGKIEFLDGDDQFVFQWIERGGPRVSPPTRKGFGSVILLDSAEQFGRVTMNYTPHGLTYGLQTRLSSIEAAVNAKQENPLPLTAAG